MKEYNYIMVDGYSNFSLGKALTLNEAKINQFGSVEKADEYIDKMNNICKSKGGEIQEDFQDYVEPEQYKVVTPAEYVAEVLKDESPEDLAKIVAGLKALKLN